MGLIISLIIAAVCGWLAGIIMKSSFPWYINIVIGLVGGALFSWIAGSFILSGIVGNIIGGVIGSCLVIFIIKLIKK
ncbi:MAG: GlsB/YeaQ/YmgE family stress response membrane protein [Clostridiales bacterium]|nr:GlsB/YeaQ/YmgE family stress response membrane protein [Clostridiales bacterium]